jgi:hypothetical protein
MGGRALIVILVGVILLSSRMFMNITGTSTEITTNADKAFLRRSARNIAQSGLNIGLRQLANDPTWRAGFPLMDMMAGKVTVTVSETTFAGQQAIRISSVGMMGLGTESEQRDTAFAFVGEGGYVPGALKAAVTTVGPAVMLSDFFLDGRDHTIASALISGQGTLGLWSTGSLDLEGTARLGGFDSGLGYIPSNPADPNSFAVNQPFPVGYPGTPDSVLGGASLGFPEGFLKYIAEHGLNGSQYVTDPTTLHYPLKGTTYVELPSGGVWRAMSVDGSGILVVHNSTRDAVMREMNAGTFKGLMLVDHPILFRANLIGALFTLAPPTMVADSLGDEEGLVWYSSEAIKDAIAKVRSLPGKGSAANVIAWWE